MKKFLCGLTLGIISFISPVHAQNLGLVPNFFTNDVSVIDIENDTVIGTLAAPTGPNSVTWLPDCSEVIVGSLTGGSFFIYNFDGNDFLFDRSVDVDFVIRGMAVTPDQTELWLADQTNGDVKIYDVASYSLIDSIDIGSGESQFFVVGGAWDIDITPNGQKAIATNDSDGTMSIIDVATHAITSSFSTGTMTDNEAREGNMSSDGSRYALTNDFGRSVQVFDVANEVLITTIDVGFRASDVRWDFNDERIFVGGNLGNNFTVLNSDIVLDEYSIDTTVSLPGEFLTLIDITPDGSKLLTVHSGTADLVNVIDPLNFSVQNQISVGNNPGGLGLFIKPSPFICQQDTLMISEFTRPVYHAKEVLIATDLANSNDILELKAADKIELKNSFEIALGSEVILTIEECPN